MCKRDGAERAEKDVDRVVGLGSSRWAPRHRLSERFYLFFFYPYHHFSRLFIIFIIIFHASVPSGSAGRVMLSKEDKEAAKMGLSVFTVRRQVTDAGVST